MSEAREDVLGVSMPKRSKTPKTRWPADKVVPAEWLAHGRAARERHNLPPIGLALEAEKFALYWGGEGRPMTDWHKTWIIWVLRAKPTPTDAKPIQAQSHPLDVDQRTVEMWRKGIRTANCGPQMLERAVEKGLLTPEQARRLGA